MDLGVIFGFIGTWILIFWTLILGGSLLVYVDVPSVILILGASVTVLFFVCPMGNIKNLLPVMKRLFFYKSPPIDDLIDQMVGFAETARRDGILSLENSLKEVEDEFVVRGIQMAVDGTDPELIEQIMENELESLMDRHEVGKGMFETLGKYAPAMGMIGTLIGLVAMLNDLSDPAKIGAGLAVALLTTMYGSMVANGFALPMADRLGTRSAEEVIYKTIIIKGVMSIQSGDNPRVVEQKLKTFLPPHLRKMSDDEEQAA
ncbi:motility protein A [Mucisphaera calidilacus]|uniref:Chemotaxis protein PomA n=1 Tax=Mucisphaera calidilacus TaxID=2527982 RepID=A0A518BYW5_9BACT|nr:motility protein A [Mucisphaera calidilacus]QDU72163.1 Chemotaxis protein PomA [Mucisphaera calidilacus]